jgi:hypothetical protein
MAAGVAEICRQVKGYCSSKDGRQGGFRMLKQKQSALGASITTVQASEVGLFCNRPEQRKPYGKDGRESIEPLCLTILSAPCLCSQEDPGARTRMSQRSTLC